MLPLTVIIVGILGSLTSTSKNQGCPGECVHAITALLCEQTLSEAKCDAAYLRCCITKSNAPDAVQSDTSENTPTVEESVASGQDSPVMKPTPQPLKGPPDSDSPGQPSESTSSQLGMAFH